MGEEREPDPGLLAETLLAAANNANIGVSIVHTDEDVAATLAAFESASEALAGERAASPCP